MDEKRLENQSDEELMGAYQGGSQAAFEEIFRRYSPRLYGFLRKRSQDNSLVEDVFQSTFQKLHQSRSKYDTSLPLSAWIFTICRNTLYDYFRKQKRSRETTSEEYDNLLEMASTQDEQTKESPEILEQLPSSQQQAVELRYYADMPFEEIALKLNTSPSNARQLVSRGLKKLRALLKS